MNDKDYGIPGFSKMTAGERVEAIKATMSPEQLEDWDKTAEAVDQAIGWNYRQRTDKRSLKINEQD